MKTIPARIEWSMSFLAVAEQGSFTAAAEHLGYSKAHLSKQISQLEAALGLKLLHRSTRRLELTPAGSTYLDYCHRLRDTLTEAERAVLSTRDQVSGKIRISVPTTFGMVFMSDFLRTLHAQHPALEVDLDLSIELRDLIADRHDLALRFDRNIPAHLIAKPLGTLDDWIVASPRFLAALPVPAEGHHSDSPVNHPASGSSPGSSNTGNPNRQAGVITHPRQLVGQPCLGNTHFPDGNEWVFSKGSESVLIEARHWARINNYPLLRQAALDDLGIARLPTYLVNDDITRGTLVRLLPDWHMQSRPVYLVFPDLRPLPSKVRATIDCLEAWYRNTINSSASHQSVWSTASFARKPLRVCVPQ